MIDMSRLYFIDSENVGDSWISLLDTVAAEDEILVFYTGKSPHMNYKSVILLKQSTKKVSFIECCEGCNALDFQLCTDLGYRVREAADREFVIVTNDTGFDAVVNYWSQRKISVKRIQGKDCGKESVLPSATAEPLPKAAEAAPVPARKGNPEMDDRAKEILYVVGKENLQMLHESLQQLYGPKKGKAYYDAFKSGTTYQSFIAKHNRLSLEEKQRLYCSIVFELAEPSCVMPEDFPKFSTDTWKKKKNLNSFRASLQGKYGKEKSELYYSLIKAHVKILDNIK